MDRSSLPWALVGSGPCSSDLVDPVGLVENRQVMVINGAIKKVPAPDYVFLTEHMAIKRYGPNVDESSQPVYLNRCLKVFKAEHARVLKLTGKTLKDPIFVPKRHLKECGSMGRALDCLVSDFGVREFEVYGVDLHPERPKSSPIRAAQLKRLHEMAEEYGLKITNCCPSSLLEGFPFEERPWTTEEVLYENA